MFAKFNQLRGFNITRRNRLTPAIAPGGVPPPASVAIVTMTLARDQAEAKCLSASLRVLAKSGLPIYLCDGGSDKTFVRQLAALPQVRISPVAPGCEITLVNQVRSAFAQAQGDPAEYVLYTEPDKRSFFNAGLKRLLAAAVQPAAGCGLALTLAARSGKSFATFPHGQRVAESIMNQVCSEAFGLAGDYTYGPMLIPKKLLGYMHLIPEDLGWGWRFFLMAVARQLGVPIDLCTVHSRCPQSQQGEDNEQARNYRLRQLVQNVTGLANGWKCLLDQPTDLIVAA